MSTITPCLWFDGKAEEAANFYASLFPDSHVDAVHRAPSDYPSGKAGDVLMVEFTLMGRPFTGLNGGPQFQFNEAISFQIPVETQAEVDRLTDALSAVPEAEQCGWVKDRFGVSWQIVPRQLIRLIGDADPARARRAFDAMMQMKRIDIAALESAAADGSPPEPSAKEVLMPVDPNAAVRISAFNWVPPFAQGQVRDLRPRWALEEAGIAYAVRKLDAMAERPADYFEEQPFGQVPSYRDDTVSLFESGAIVLHIGRDCETLLPADPAARARATAWLIAALNSVEPYLMQLATIDIFAAGEEWAKLRRPGVIEMIDKRLSRLSDALGDKSYLDGDRFTAGDLMMTTVLRIIDGKGLLDRYSNLVAYKARCQARPAFQAALAAQIADFEEREPVSA